MPPLPTFRSPEVSLWQSAVAEVLAQERANQPAVLGEEVGPASQEPIMLQTVAAAAAILQGEPVPPAVLGLPIEDCAQLYLQLIIAEARGDVQAATQLKNDIAFFELRPLWAKCLLEYEKYRIFKADPIPYRGYESLDDYILPLTGQNPEAIKIALIADWGTGEAPARHLLYEVGRQAPDVLIHLGDIYYSGTSREVQENFLDVCRNTDGLRGIPIYTLSGNHDMYSGGQGYYWLLDQLGQPASYFCLRNDDWQLLAMDTGLHDASPYSVVSNLTYLDEREQAWQRDKILNAGGRRTILLSHHQLFCASGGVGNTQDGKPLAVNSRLYETFADVLDQVELWMWGHEHNLIVYDEYVGLKRGRCNGSSAVPTLLAQNPYAPDPNLLLPDGQHAPPIMRADCRLGDNGEFYYHAYAMVTLKGKAADIAYYQIPGPDAKRELIYIEQIHAE